MKKRSLWLLAAVALTVLLVLFFSLRERARCDWQNIVGPQDPTVPTTLIADKLPAAEKLRQWWPNSVELEAFRGAPPEKLWNGILSQTSTEPLPTGVASCAVVGNSGNLNGSGYGDIIDRHDWVIRMNEAPTTGFEADVGSKLTHHFLQLFSAERGAIYPQAQAIFILFNELQRSWLEKSRATVLGKIPKERFRILHPAFFHLVDESWLGGTIPSTGVLAIAFALRHCQKVDVFGFGADKNGNWDHYFRANDSRPVQFHSRDREADIRQCLERAGSITVFAGRR